MNIYKLKNRLTAIKALLKGDEYFLVVSYKDNNDNYGPIRYDYMNNTNRDLFYVFVNDYLKNKE